jgi:protein-S-isoprenylcysteine O-methyltransferase Ste14
MWILPAVGALGYGVHATHGAAWSAHQIAGLAIGIPALCLWALARLELGKSFSISAQAKELVTHGLYSKIQNPVYVFGSILIVGAIVYFGQPKYFLVFLIILPMQLVRVREERRVLEAKFGDAYREYRKKTWF